MHLYTVLKGVECRLTKHDSKAGKLIDMNHLNSSTITLRHVHAGRVTAEIFLADNFRLDLEASMHWLRMGVAASAMSGLCMLLLLCDLTAWAKHSQHLPSKVINFFLLTESPRPIAVPKTSPLLTQTDPNRRAKAAIVVLAQNADLRGVLLSMQRMEQRFNARYQYPYVFLNEEQFNADFRQRTSASTQSRTLYGLIPQKHWSLPDWVSQKQFDAARATMQRAGVLYAGKASYHFMCRFYSGFFHQHPLLQEFEYYWRMEPDVHYYCDLDYDPFVFMEDRGVQYGFVIAVMELPNTIPSLWNTTQSFIQKHAQRLPHQNLMAFVTTQSGQDYNLCHFWSNFEIASFQFLRSTQYQAYFQHLDRANGFFMERWGDAPVHSLAAAMFLNKSQVHHFHDIGYRHNSFTHCPARLRNNCACDALKSVDFHTPSFGICHKRWSEVTGS